MNRDYARLVNRSDPSKSLRFLFDVGCMEEKPTDFNYDSITDYVTSEFVPSATNFIVQNVSQNYEKARRICEKNGIDCAFPIYEETALEKDVLVYPCECGRFAYLLTTVVGPLEDRGYEFRFKMQAGPFGSSNENGVITMQPSLVEVEGGNSVFLRPVQAIKIPNGTNSPFDSEIWTALFVDWRFFAWDYVYEKRQITDDLETRRKYCYTPELYSVIAQTTAGSDAFLLNQEECQKISLSKRIRIKDLRGAPLPLAVDHILACYGYRLYGGRTPIPVWHKSFFTSSIEQYVDFVKEGLEGDSSRLTAAIYELSMRPTETRVYFRNDKYGAFADCSAGLSNETNKTVCNSMKTIKNWRFYVESAIGSDPFKSDMLYVTNFHDATASPNSWSYSTFRTKKTDVEFYEGDSVDGDLQPSKNSAEVNSLEELNQTVEYDGTTYFTTAQPTNAPINAGGIFEDVARYKTRGGTFSAENVEQFGIKQATVVAIEGGYVYVTSDKNYRCQIPGEAEDLDLQVGDSILIGCNPKNGTVYPIVNKTGEESEPYEGGTRIGIDGTVINWLGLTTTENSVDGAQTTGVLNLSGSKRIQVANPQGSWAQAKWTGVTVGVDQGWTSSYRGEDEAPQRPSFDDATEIQFDCSHFETTKLKNNDDGSVVLVKLKAKNENNGVYETPFENDSYVWFDNAASCEHRVYESED